MDVYGQKKKSDGIAPMHPIGKEEKKLWESERILRRVANRLLQVNYLRNGKSAVLEENAGEKAWEDLKGKEST